MSEKRKRVERHRGSSLSACRRSQSTISIAGPRPRLRLQATQEDGDDGGDVLLVGQSIRLQRWQEQFAAKLWQQHADKGAGAGAYIVRPETAEFDLAREVGFDEVEDARNHP